MDWLLFSYYSPGAFFVTLLSFVIVTFLILKKGKVRSTYWLLGFYLGEIALFAAYTASYSIFAPFGANHRYVSLLTMFGCFSLAGFAYHYPKNDRPKEAAVVLSISFVVSVIAYIHFVLNTLNMEKIYSFKSQIYTYDFGKEVGIVIMALFCLTVFVLCRKTIQYSDYRGIFAFGLNKPEKFYLYPYHLLSHFLVGIIKLINPKGKDAEATRAFAIPIFLYILVAYLNVLVKSNRISYDLFALLFSFSTMFVIYYMVIVYLDHSPEPTSFMVKLVGISLGAILVVLGYAGELTLSESESNYDEKRILQINQTRMALRLNSWEAVPNEVEYILVKPKSEPRFSNQYQVLFSKNPNLTQEELEKSQALEKAQELKEKIANIKEKNMNDSEKETLALKEISNSLEPELTRSYRLVNSDFFTQFNYIEDDKRYEVGFSYLEYRKIIHKTSRMIIYAMIFVAIIVLVFFPMLFRSSLVRPLNKLLSGVGEVNEGNLNVNVPIKSYDEIGYLATSFNSMVKSIRQAREELQDYAENLEERVEERTKEVREKMELIENLKVQQDGDYFLTSLLAKPLFYNANKSLFVKTEFIIKQKKSFEFRKNKGDLGGDICVTGNLRLGTKEKFKRYTMAMNGDAMGKSMQGAGGSLVMGVVMNSIMARSASQNKILNQTPEEWLFQVYKEIHSVFMSFNGTMAISAVIFIIEDQTGEAYYINAEHPYSVLYRDRRAKFIEEEIHLRKIGFDLETEFTVDKVQLQEGDVIILGSDGRDDIDLTPNESQRTINEDETLFLEFVEKAGSDLNQIILFIENTGTVIDDLSLLRIGYKENYISEIQSKNPESISSTDITVKVSRDGSTKTITDFHSTVALDTENAYLEGKLLTQKNRTPEAISLLYSAFQVDRTHEKLNRLLGILLYKTKEYKKAIEVIQSYLSQFERDQELLYYLAVSLKKMRKYAEGIQVSNSLYQINPSLIRNILNLADLYRITNDPKNAVDFCKKALALDPKNEIASKILRSYIQS